MCTGVMFGITHILNLPGVLLPRIVVRKSGCRTLATTPREDDACTLFGGI